MSKYYINMETSFTSKSGIYTFSNDWPTEADILKLTENCKYRIIFMQRLEG